MKTSNNLKYSGNLPSIVPIVFLFIPGNIQSQNVKQTEARLMKQADENIEK
jgi:hypothetical protein